MKPVYATDQQKPLSTLQTCIEEVNGYGATGTLTWSDGFTVSLGTVVHIAILPIGESNELAFAYAVQGFEEGGTHHAGYHVHRGVNWSAEDPPLLFSMIDDEGSTLTFELIEPSVDTEAAEAYTRWRQRLDVDPEQKAEALARVQEALVHQARHWSEEA